ncbi:sensor histidine kinase [Rhodococcus erythropolis]|jgi:signal transduction histidine kinase|uniref:sensor histidine kinase n=1 Tax=Rhodococcus erythropolis TaxID=1833 RepID=UPI0008CD25A7|nr:histidine kinase [Rhodococcus erythropolis]OFV75543.1 sensor histidine kinase DesK [Rhodococcus erythropolis]
MMNYQAPGEDLAGRPLTRWAFDSAVALAAVAVASPYVFYDDEHALAVAIVTLLGVHAPLVLRRTHPVPVFVWILVTAAAAGLWNDHVIAGLGLLIALYTVVATQPRPSGIVATAAVELLMILAALRAASTNWWPDILLLSSLVGAAAGMGLYASTRRAYLAELLARAAYLEIERDQQGALAAAAERNRISREMHDIVAHHLSVMVALSDGAVAATTSSPDRGIEVMRTVSETGRSALADTRRLLGVLRRQQEPVTDALIPTPGLAELDNLIELVRSAGIATTLHVHGAVAVLADGIQLTVYRLIQEALTNTLKHGGPGTSAVVTIRYTPRQLIISVEDDGAGTPEPATGDHGAGLIGIRERVLAYDGSVTAGPNSRGGWTVTATLDLIDSAAQ